MLILTIIMCVLFKSHSVLVLSYYVISSARWFLWYADIIQCLRFTLYENSQYKIFCVGDLNEYEYILTLIRRESTLYNASIWKIIQVFKLKKKLKVQSLPDNTHRAWRFFFWFLNPQIKVTEGVVITRDNPYIDALRSQA